MVEQNNPFVIEDEARVTYINNVTGEKWPEWKLYKDCTDEEKQKINLAQYPSNCICLDRDLKDYTDEQIEADYQLITKSVKKKGMMCFYSYRSPHGYHILIPIEGLDKFDEDLRREIRKFYVDIFLSDPAKISDRGVLSLPDRPHFKNGMIYHIKENFVGVNGINQQALEICIERVKSNKLTIQKVNKDVDFANFFETDNFFNFVKNNVIPDGTNRDNIIFPNLAVAAYKSGKTKEQIKEIMEPIIKNNFPGKTWPEFNGWLKKAFKEEIKDWNPIQLNNWSKIYTQEKKDFYDLSKVPVLKLEDIDKDKTISIEKIQNKGKFNFIWDRDFLSREVEEVEWLIENWIARGDTNFMVGKAASFKSTIILSLAYAVANGLLALNAYKTKKMKVLYINEENSEKNFCSMIKRVKRGLGLDENVDNDVCFSQMENLKFDDIEHLKYLIDFIKKNDIGWIIVDSFRRVISFDENSANEMNKFTDNLKVLKKFCNNVTISMIHHTKKDAGGKYVTDVRDMLRGSSDIVNAADSIIYAERRSGKNSLLLSHIKNRSGLEMEQKLINIDNGEDDDQAYFYESAQQPNPQAKSAIENCADEIANLKEKGIKDFEKKDLQDIIKKYSAATTTRALRQIREEGLVIDDGSPSNNPHKRYTFV